MGRGSLCVNGIEDGANGTDNVELDHCSPEYPFFPERGRRVQSLELSKRRRLARLALAEEE